MEGTNFFRFAGRSRPGSIFVKKSHKLNYSLLTNKRKHYQNIKWDTPVTADIDKPRLFRVLYSLNGKQDKQISIALHPDIDDQPLLTFSKRGYRGVKLTVDEWNQIMNHKETIEKHLRGEAHSIMDYTNQPVHNSTFFLYL
jgi:hypothetical protein